MSKKFYIDGITLSDDTKIPFFDYDSDGFFKYETPCSMEENGTLIDRSTIKSISMCYDEEIDDIEHIFECPNIETILMEAKSISFGNDFIDNNNFKSLNVLPKLKNLIFTNEYCETFQEFLHLFPNLEIYIDGFTDPHDYKLSILTNPKIKYVCKLEHTIRDKNPEFLQSFLEKYIVEHNEFEIIDISNLKSILKEIGIDNEEIDGFSDDYLIQNGIAIFKRKESRHLLL